MAEFSISEVLPNSLIENNFLKINLSDIESKITSLNIPGVTFTASSPSMNYERIHIALQYILSSYLTDDYRAEDTTNRQLVVSVGDVSNFTSTDEEGNIYQSKEVTHTLYRRFTLDAFSPDSF